MTTPQTYALFAMIACVIILIGISYCVGLKTGKAAGVETSKPLHEALRTIRACKRDQAIELASTLQTLDMRERELGALRKNITDEFDDHTRVEQQLLSQLETAKAKGLTQDDYLTLKLAAKQLGTAAAQFIKSGSNKINQAFLAQERLNEVANRLHPALNTEPLTCKPVTDAAELTTDTHLVEWLDEYASYHGDEESGELRFPVTGPLEGFEHVRDVLHLAIQQQRTDDYGTTIGEAA
ncbi:MAG: hypothetical protein WA173_01650 [Pseudomonas sp.]|uniref:hypothetical protein n=1 Tax=Pseudomonas sp. TaxID=306 RepID=UPI003BB6557A